MVEPRRLRPPMRRFEYFAPQSLAEAIALFGEKGEGGRALAGGTDLVPQIKEGGKIPMPSYVVSLRHLPELRGIEFSERAGLRIGPAVAVAELAESPVVRERYRALADGAGVVGSVQTMNMATIGGNVCNAAPSADTAPALLAHEALAVIAGRDGERQLPLAGVWRGPERTGARRGGATDQRPARLGGVPPPPGARHHRALPAGGGAAGAGSIVKKTTHQLILHGSRFDKLRVS